MPGMKKSDYLDMRKQIQAEYEEKLAALDKVFGMFGGTPISTNGTSPKTALSLDGWPHDISKRDAVRNAVKVLTVPQFSLKDVRKVLNTDYAEYSAGIKDNQLSAILSKLAENGEFTVVKRKLGKAPAVYGHKVAS